MIVAKAVDKVRHTHSRLYNLRAIRATRATEWIMEKREYEAMGWKPLPPNPLSHSSETTVIHYYAQ